MMAAMAATMTTAMETAAMEPATATVETAARAAAPAVPARTTAPAETAAPGEAAIIVTRSMPAARVKTIILAAEEELRMFDRKRIARHGSKVFDRNSRRGRLFEGGA
jgi:hypothetical protein